MLRWLANRQDERRRSQQHREKKEALARLMQEYQDAKVELFKAIVPRVETGGPEIAASADAISAVASNAMTGEDSSKLVGTLTPKQRSFAESLGKELLKDRHLEQVAIRAAYVRARTRVLEAHDHVTGQTDASIGHEVIRLLEVPLSRGRMHRDAYLTTLGQAHVLLAEFAEAHDAAAEAIEIGPGNAQAWRVMGDAFLGLEWPKDALESYSKAKVLDPAMHGIDAAIRSIATEKNVG